MKCLEDGYIVAKFCKVSCAGKTCRAGTDNRDLVAVFLCCRNRFDTVFFCPVSNETLQFTDGNSVAFDSADTFALALALLRTYTAADCGSALDSPIILYASSKFPSFTCAMNAGMLILTGHPVIHFAFLQPRQRCASSTASSLLYPRHTSSKFVARTSAPAHVPVLCLIPLPLFVTSALAASTVMGCAFLVS